MPDTDPLWAVQITNLTRRFGSCYALDGLNLQVPEGAVFGLLGNNGAGKTTTLYSIMGLLPPTAGHLRVLGLDPQRHRIELLQQTGFVSEADTPYEWMQVATVFEMGRRSYATWDPALCDQLCQQLQLDPTRKVRELSKGMTTKMKLVFALSHRAKLLILDEPTSGLDPGSRHELLQLIRDISRDHHRTTLFSSHYMEEVDRIATHVGILHAGQLLFTCALADLHHRMLLVHFDHTPEAGPPAAAPAPIAHALLAQVTSERATQWLLRASVHPDQEFLPHLPLRANAVRPTLAQLFLLLTRNTPVELQIAPTPVPVQR